MANTGATLIGSYESVRVMEQAGVPADRMICVAGGERVDLGDDVTVSVLPEPALLRVVPARQMPQADDVCLGDLGVTWQEQQERMRELMALPGHRARRRTRSSTCSPRCPGTARAVTVARCSSCSRRPTDRSCTRTRPGTGRGVLGGLRPDVAILAAAGRGNVDGEPIQGSLADFVGRPGRPAAAPPGGAEPPRRLAPGLLGGDRHGADPPGHPGRLGRNRAARAGLPRAHRTLRLTASECWPPCECSTFGVRSSARG